MQFIPTALSGAIEIIPRIFEDERGYFFESYNKELFAANGIPFEFLQDNQSYSKKGVLRGLHFQRRPYAQGKLVRVITGRVIDVAVDLRQGSSTYGQHVKVLLDAAKGNMFYVPEGFAHGFITLEDAIFSYKCTNVYSKVSEGGVIWNDKDLNIDWEIQAPLVSEKDAVLPGVTGIEL